MPSSHRSTPSADRSGGTGSPVRRSKGAWRKRWLRAGLAIGTFVAAAILLEVVARLAFPTVRLYPAREGVFHHSLPIVNRLSGPGRIEQRGPEGQRLSLEPGPDELRVFVFGESSVEGSPWSVTTSIPAMMRDALAARFPERRVNVVNMGRRTATMLDTYYYLVGVARYRPDVVVFYQGTNDRFDAGFENCLPARHPRIHAVWRWHVEHSRLLWTVRTFGPAALRLGARPNTAPAGPGRSRGCSPGDGQQAWTDILLDGAAATGAKLVVVTPVHNPLTTIELGGPDGGPVRGLAGNVDVLDGRYRDLVRCTLDPQCPPWEHVAAWLGSARPAAPARDGAASSDRRRGSLMAASIDDLDRLRRIWIAGAEAHDAAVVDFCTTARNRSPGGILMEPLIVDSVHLSLQGYATVALLATDTVEAQIRDEPPPPAVRDDFGVPDWEDYRTRLDDEAAPDGVGSYCHRNLAAAEHWLSHGGMHFGIGFLQVAWSHCEDETAGLVLAWLHLQLDVPSELPADLLARAANVDVDALLREVASRR